jgi:hypothetical protein
MKTMFLLLFTPFLLFFSNGYGQNQPVQSSAMATAASKGYGPVVKWDKTAEEMGDIPQGTPRTAEFRLTNDGNEPLLISSAQASCGCTNLVYSKEPLLPGKSSLVTATYNAVAKGPFMKTITVRTNAGEQATVLQIKGNVLEKPVLVKQ